MKVLVCGDRNWSDKNAIRSWLSKLQDWGYTELIEGGARGADTIAKEEATLLHMNRQHFPAQWDKYGKAAGPIRNRAMLDQQPDLVLAFHGDIGSSKGTRDCVNEAIKRGIPTIVEGG